VANLLEDSLPQYFNVLLRQSSPVSPGQQEPPLTGNHEKDNFHKRIFGLTKQLFLVLLIQLLLIIFSLSKGGGRWKRPLDKN
jgi:hypothetical protein